MERHTQSVTSQKVLGTANNRIKHQYMIVDSQGLQKLGTNVVQQLLSTYFKAGCR